MSIVHSCWRGAMLLLTFTVHLVAVIQLILLLSPARSAQLRTGSAGGRSDGSRLRFIHEVREVSSVYLKSLNRYLPTTTTKAEAAARTTIIIGTERAVTTRMKLENPTTI